MNNIIIYKNEMGDTVEFSKRSGFFLTDFPLLSGLSIDVSTSQSIDQLGGTIESQVVNPKTVTVKGFIQGDGTAGKQKLLQVIRPLEKGRFTVNGQYSIDVVVSDTPTVERMRMFPQFDFGVTAPYPFWQRTEAGMTPVAGTIGMFRFPWYFKSYTFGVLVKSYFSTIHNGGQIPTFYDLRITANGAAKNPEFMDVATGDFLKLNKTFSVGGRVTISIRPDRVTAVSSTEGDIQGLIDIDSTLFSFRAGDTTLRYDAEEGKENLNVQITLSDKFAGIVV